MSPQLTGPFTDLGNRSTDPVWGEFAPFLPCEPARIPDLGRLRWWDRICPSYPVTVSAQVQSRTWR